MLAFKYISLHYLKYIVIILGALVAFMVGFDYIQNASSLPSSANLVVIYLVFKAFFAVDMLLPIALVFAMISTKIYLIRSNALVSFYSLGYTRIDILKPFLVVSTLIIILFISLHNFSSFSRSYEFAKNIRLDAQYLSPTRDLFFTYKDKYVYFSKMIPLQERAEDVRIFSVDNNSLQEVLVASSAVYKDGFWFIKKADLIVKPKKMDFQSMGIKVTEEQNLQILKGFRPKMLDQVYEGKVNFTIRNAVDALILLNEQNINTSTIRSALYKIFIYPLFVPFLVVIIFFFVPVSVRFVNLSLFSSGAILVTLMVWGILFMLIELSNHKTIPSEVGIVLPIFLLFLGALYQYRKYRALT